MLSVRGFEVDSIALAVSIEAQALDFHTCAAERSVDPRSEAALSKIAEDERGYLAQLGKPMDERM